MACIGGVSGEWVLRILYLYLHLFLYYLYQYSRFTISLNHKDNQSSRLGERVSAWLGLESRYKSICGEILRPSPHSFKNNWEEIHFEMCTLSYFTFSKILLADHDLDSFALPNSDTILYLGCLSSMKGQLCSILSEYCFFFSKSRDQLLLVNFQYFQDTVMCPKFRKLVLSSAMKNSWPVS